MRTFNEIMKSKPGEGRENYALVSQNPTYGTLKILEGKYKGKKFKNKMEMNKFFKKEKEQIYKRRNLDKNSRLPGMPTKKRPIYYGL